MEQNNLWFVYESYSLSNCTKMEAEIYNYGKQLILHKLVGEGDMENAAEALRAKQEELAAENPRWKRVEIKLNNSGDIAWLHVGPTSSFSIRKVKGIYNDQ